MSSHVNGLRQYIVDIPIAYDYPPVVPAKAVHPEPQPVRCQASDVEICVYAAKIPIPVTKLGLAEVFDDFVRNVVRLAQDGVVPVRRQSCTQLTRNGRLSTAVNSGESGYHAE